MKVTTSALIRDTSKKLNTTTSMSSVIILEFIDQVITTLIQGDDVEIRGLGTFKNKETKEKTAVNPRTKEQIIIKPKKTIKFRPSYGIGRIINV